MKLSSFYQRRGSTLAGIFSVAFASVVLLCGAGTGPGTVENFLPQGAMQGDLNAGGHSLTNAATVSATNVVVSGSLTMPSGFTLPFSSVTGAPTLGPLATVTPSGTASSSTYLRGDNSWATVPSGYTLPVATASVLGGVKQGANVTIAGDGTLSIATPVLSANNGSDFASIPTTRRNLGVAYNQVIASSTSNTVTTAQIGALFNYTTGTNTLTPTIPTAATAGNGATYYFRKADSGSGSVLVNGVLLGIAGHALEMVSDGTSWYNRPFFGGIDASGNIAISSPLNGNLTFTPGGTGAFTINGNANASSYSMPTGPAAVGTRVNCDGDSRVSGAPTGVTGINATMLGYLGYYGLLPSMLQVSPFFQNMTVLSTAYPGIGVADLVANYQLASVVTTASGTAGTNKLVITGSTTGVGLTNGGIGGPGILPGTSYTYTSGTVTLLNGQDNRRAPVVSNLVSTQTNANYDFATALPNVAGSSVPLAVTCDPHESSSAVSGFPSYYLFGIGINDSIPLTFTGTTTIGSNVITGINNIRQMVPGYAVSGTGVATGATVTSNTPTTLLMSANATATGTTTITITPVDAAWGAEVTVLVNKALADSSIVLVLTTPPAHTTPYTTNDAHRVAFNNYLISTYGGSSGLNGATVSGVYVIDSASMPIWTASNYAQYYLPDLLHFSTAGETQWANFISAKCAQLFPSAMTGPVQTLNAPIGINPQDINWGRYLVLDPLNQGGELDLGTNGTAPEIFALAPNVLIKGQSGGILDFSNTSTGWYKMDNMVSSGWGVVTSYPGMSSSGVMEQVGNANGTLAAQTGTATIATASSSNAYMDSFTVSASLNVTALATDTIELEVTYTDENNVAQAQLLYPVGATSALISATGAYAFQSVDVHTKNATTATLKTILPTSSGSITYDAAGHLQQAY